MLYRAGTPASSGRALLSDLRAPPYQFNCKEPPRRRRYEYENCAANARRGGARSGDAS